MNTQDSLRSRHSKQPRPKSHLQFASGFQISYSSNPFHNNLIPNSHLREVEEARDYKQFDKAVTADSESWIKCSPLTWVKGQSLWRMKEPISYFPTVDILFQTSNFKSIYWEARCGYMVTELTVSLRYALRTRQVFIHQLLREIWGKKHGIPHTTNVSQRHSDPKNIKRIKGMTW